ncbi:bifunctional FolD protein Methylenetetrahydrofolate dehydrogenase/Methenyltetrahydrofolate cyclohydrolase [Candidatus Nitrosocosmicus arcticus]|uniref:Bifunctional protein FolD n=1 Tax=Candidatus Nitrosocosmicus arcticus TaxID=2035267 RepID=A0A557SX74_9ARCH|nr:bifunctional 5,10-methylenetetrahydrofolate dehydrogenase/5,10-methenyltetrahydrofolate cyclohydrolase [Candidatus Nitrosocosmicus arcticus]TVP41205.1 bifunctional FolD protein Methylenetetrahydrofolate dehydrogenase/Methenyltetrahydrofolate cyclohydrolase [Candidatus Nitrosocosmicus arcticus]
MDILTAMIIDGLVVSNRIKNSLKNEISGLVTQGVIPCLATILIGSDPPSLVYINNKQKAANSIGIRTLDFRFDADISQTKLIRLIEKLNLDSTVHGILIQLPLPDHLDKYNVINMVDPRKDVDGLTFINSGLLLNNKTNLIPCTPLGIMELFRNYKIQLDGANVLIVNRSNLVGKPLASLLLSKNSTVTISHSHTKNLKFFSQNADIIVTAVGNRDSFVLTDDMVTNGATIIDVGTNRVDGKLCGDVDFEKVKEKARYITPVPGGVGPMTICMLLRNTVEASKAYAK